MTLFDLAALVILVIYVALGWYTGTVRRVLGAIFLYLAILVATYMGSQGADMLMSQQPGMPLPDARLLSWLFFLVLILLILEGGAAALRRELRLAVVAFDRTAGVLVGVVTAAVLVTTLGYMLDGYSKPISKQPDNLQISVRDAVQNSGLASPLARSLIPTVHPLLNAALPRNAQAYFNLESGGQ